jgi:ATP-dependent phosphofructokinase / diphosphate-dependent phosphofructokinase
MVTLHREAGAQYRVRYASVALEEVARATRAFPSPWISPDGADVTDEFVRYALPLIGSDWPQAPTLDGRQRFCRFEPRWAEKLLSPYVPEAYR